MKRTKDNKISYIRKPLADNGGYCLGTAIAALLGGIAGMAAGVLSHGSTPLAAVSLCFGSLLFSAAAVYFGIRSFREKEKNYILARIGLSIGGLLLIVWLMIILVGGRE
jgi:hypothetical protein